MSAPPFMPFYVSTYLGDTMALTTLEHGAYCLLLFAMWQAGGSLPAADDNLRRIAKLTPEEWAGMRDLIMPYFKRRGGRIYSPRMRAEFEKYDVKVEQAIRAGLASGAKRRNKNKAIRSTGVERAMNNGDIDYLKNTKKFLNEEFRAKAIGLMGPDWVASYLDPAEWQDIPDKLIIARNGTAADRIRRELRPLLTDIAVEVRQVAA